jgi:hypothetical protein
MRTATIDIPVQQGPAQRAARADAPVIVLSTAELAECTCPEWCERDHDRD